MIPHIIGHVGPTNPRQSADTPEQRAAPSLPLLTPQYFNTILIDEFRATGYEIISLSSNASSVKLSLLPGVLLGASTLLAYSMEKDFKAELTVPVGYPYVLTVPDGYGEDPAKKWPLLIFLHGAGERGSDLSRLKTFGPLKQVAEGRKLPMIIASPQVAAGEIWDAHSVHALTEELASSLPVDRNRIYLTGLSMGGFGTWETAIKYPDTYAALVPICGGAGVRLLQAGRLKSTPVWIFHGAEDDVVSPSQSEKIHEALERAGNTRATLTIYPGVGHGSWNRAYEEDELWDWLLKQSKSLRLSRDATDH